MKNVWIAGILLAATLGINSTANAIDTSKLPHDIQEAIAQYNQVNFDAGLLGLQQVIPDCYSKAKLAKQKEAAEQCIMLDMLTYFSNKQSIQMGMDFKLDNLSYDATDKRMRSILTDSGMTDSSKQNQYLNNMAEAAKAIINE